MNSADDAKRRIQRFWQKNSTLTVLLLVAAAAFYVSQCWYQLMLMQGPSMEPSYHNYQLVLLDRHTKSYRRGDVIALHSDQLHTILVKRIAAQPGDTVQIKDGIFYLNGEAQPFPRMERAGLAAEPVVLAENEYFVLGDNVAQSKDSRDIGCILDTDIRGEVVGAPALAPLT